MRAHVCGSRGRRLRVRVRVSQPALVPDLVEFLGRAFCRTDSVHGSVVDVALPGIDDGDRARRELGLYLAAWTGLHPPVEATILESDVRRHR
jgi:hypothetical protein